MAKEGENQGGLTIVRNLNCWLNVDNVHGLACLANLIRIVVAIHCRRTGTIFHLLCSFHLMSISRSRRVATLSQPFFFHASILEPYFHLTIGQIEPPADLLALFSRHELGSSEFRLKFLNLELRVWPSFLK